MSGHRMGTAGRSALVAHPKVAEAAVVGYLDIKGQGIYAYVTLGPGQKQMTHLPSNYGNGHAPK